MTGLVWILPTVVGAQGLVPCNPKLGADGKLADQCGFCEVGKLILNLSDWVVYISGIIVVLLIIGGGLRLAMSQDVGAKATLRRLLTAALFGYMMVLGAWMIVDLFIKFLIPGSSYGVGNPLICP